jgi:hypothetical protein
LLSARNLSSNREFTCAQTERIQRFTAKGLIEFAFVLAGDNVSDQTAIVTRLIATGQLSEAVHWQNRLGLHVDSGLSPEELERMMREEADRYLSLPWPISDDSHVRMVDNHESLQRLTDSVWGCVPARCTPFVRGQRGRKEEGEICTQSQLRNHGGMPSLTQYIETRARTRTQNRPIKP